MKNLSHFPQNPKIGFHYYPDTFHYRESDLIAWLPELQSLAVSWLVLQATTERSIPESFLRGLLNAQIQPILSFDFSISSLPQPSEVKTLFETYQKWGVNFISFLNRPNIRSSWSPSEWLQEELVERYLDRYLPIANLALKSGIIPLFPILEPGGNYWDTAFLHGALMSLQRRQQTDMLDSLILSASAQSHNQSLQWGAGGPMRFPASRPYHTPPGEQNQIGFRIYEWYLTIARSILGQTPPIVLFEVGTETIPSPQTVDTIKRTRNNLAIASLLLNQKTPNPSAPDETLDPLPEAVLGACFWLLATPPDHPEQSAAWFPTNGIPLPEVGAIKQMNASMTQPELPPVQSPPASAATQPVRPIQPINHYLLLPHYEWGIADWHLDIIRPFVKKYQPTIGFSIAEASLAARVTVIGGQQSFPEEVLDQMRSAGCQVERISGDGTSIATQLAER